MQLQFLAFLTRAKLYFFIYLVLRAWFITSTLCYWEGHFQPLWKVKGLEQYTSWKVRVPECVLLEKYEHQHVHIQINVHANFMCVYIYLCVYVCVFAFFVVWCRVMSCAARRWVVGWLGVGRCGVVWCVICCRSIATGKSGAFNDWPSNWTVHGCVVFASFSKKRVRSSG